MPNIPYEKQPKASRRLRDRDAIALRVLAHGRDAALAEHATAELRRRIANLRGAVIPAWELEKRGPEPTRWELV